MLGTNTYFRQILNGHFKLIVSVVVVGNAICGMGPQFVVVNWNRGMVALWDVFTVEHRRKLNG